jgi:hypothetical protein
MTTILWGGALVVLAGFVGGFVGYMAALAVFSFLEGLALPNRDLVDAHPSIPRLGAIFGAGLAILGLVFLFKCAR